MRLDEIKRGDKVLVYGYQAVPNVGTVSEITKGGAFRVGKELYMKSGYLRGTGRWTHSRIAPFDQETLDSIKSDHVYKVRRNKVTQFNWYGASPEIIEAAYRLIESL